MTLTETALAFTDTMRDIFPTIKEESDWAPLTAFVNTAEYERVGPFLDRNDWASYTAMLSQWKGGTGAFETTLGRTAEVGNRVYVEFEERHQKSERTSTVRSLTVFEFDDAGKIRRMDVFLQHEPQEF